MQRKVQHDERVLSLARKHLSENRAVLESLREHDEGKKVISTDAVRRALQRSKAPRDATRVAGRLTITTFRDGKPVRAIGPFPNKVVMGTGTGRNIIARQIAGDTTYAIEIDSASVGDDNTAAVDADTDLGNPLVEDIPITNKTAVDDDVSVDVFVADANLPDDTYEEFGLFCDGQLFARIIISPAYTKASGEDTLFSYELGIT